MDWPTYSVCRCQCASWLPVDISVPGDVFCVRCDTLYVRHGDYLKETKRKARPASWKESFEFHYEHCGILWLTDEELMEEYSEARCKCESNQWYDTYNGVDVACYECKTIYHRESKSAKILEETKDKSTIDYSPMIFTLEGRAIYLTPGSILDMMLV